MTPALPNSKTQTLDMQELPESLFTPANSDYPMPELSSGQRFVEWLLRVGVKTNHYTTQDVTGSNQDTPSIHSLYPSARDDWQTITSICGHHAEDFLEAGLDLPLSNAEIDHFRRNHRETDNLVSRDFLAARSDLPSPLAELYGLYRHRARLDAEAALFVAQATNTTRIAEVMADLLAIGSYANGHEHITHMAQVYSVPAAFDTSAIIDETNREAQFRLDLPSDHPSHLLHMSPDEISLLAADIVERNILSSLDFTDKASLLAEARLDVARMEPSKRFATSIIDGDLPTEQSWVARICAAYSRTLDLWLADIPGIEDVVRRADGSTAPLI